MRSDDKKRARLNCISHLLSVIPYQKVRKEKIKLPQRSKKHAYDDAATLAGTGSINGATSVSGTLNPGVASVGSLTVNNSLTLNSTAATFPFNALRPYRSPSRKETPVVQTFEAWLNAEMSSRGIRSARRLAMEARLDPDHVGDWQEVIRADD